MRRIVTAVSAAALALSMVAQAAPANAVAGYDSAYAGESAFLTLGPNATGTFTVFFLNTGTTTWTKGTATQVDLAACLEDKVTCNAQDATEAPYNPGTWLSATRYATTTQTSVAPGQVGTFTYDVKAPASPTAGVKRFNGALRLASDGADIHNEGYFQDVNQTTTAAAGGIAISPASDTNQTGTSHSITVTLTDTAGAALTNQPIDIFVVNDAAAFTTGGSCDRDTSANPNFTGQTACTIDINDPITDSAGKVSFSWTGSAKETHRVVAWTAAQGTVFNSTATLTQGSATKTWIGAITLVNSTPSGDTNPFATSHTQTAQLEEADGTDVALAGASVIWQVVRGGTDAGTTCTGGTVVLVQTTTTDSAGKATFTYTGPADPSGSAGNTIVDCVFAFYDSNGNGTFESGTDPSDADLKTWSDATAGTGNTVVLSPTRDGNPESSNHTVTATMSDVFGNPVVGATITFQVTRFQTTTAPASMGVVLTGTRTTDSAGVASFSYTGPSFNAEDRIDACGSLNADTDCTDTNEVDFAAVSNVHKFWATLGTTATYTGGVLFCDSANDTIYLRRDGAAGDVRLIYDSGDQFFLGAVDNNVAGDGTPTTLSGFESSCDSASANTTGGDPTINDQATVDFEATTTNVSQFELEGSEPD